MKSNTEASGNKLRVLRDQAEMQLSQMAEQLGNISASQLSRIERSDRIPDGLEAEYKTAVQRHMATKTDPAEFHHITNFLKIVNTPPGSENGEKIKDASEKERETKKICLPEQITEISSLEMVSRYACALLEIHDGSKPQEAMIVSLGEWSLFDPGSQPHPNTKWESGIEGDLADHRPKWHGTLLKALLNQCTIKHIFERNKDTKQLFTRMSGVAELCRDVPLDRGKYSASAINDREHGLTNDILLVHGRGLLLVFSNAKGTIEGGVFFPEVSQRFKQQEENFRLALRASVPFIDLHTRSIIQAKFSEADQYATDDRIMMKNGLYILMVPDYVSKARMDRILPSQKLSSAEEHSIKTNMTGTFDRRLKRFQRWSMPLDKRRIVHLLSQRSLTNFLETGELEDGLEYQIYRSFSEKDRVSADAPKQLMERIAFTLNERLAILEAIIDFIATSPERYELLLVESFASYGLDKVGYFENRPDIWWAISNTGAFFLFGRQMSTDDQVVLETSDPMIKQEFHRYFTALAFRIKQEGKPVEFVKTEQLKWLKGLLAALKTKMRTVQSKDR